MRWSRRPPRDDGGAPDADLTFLSTREATDFRAEVRTVLAGMGYEVAVHGGYVTTIDGREWGLWNIAALCHHDPRGRRSWSELVTGHFTPLLRPDPAHSMASLDDEELLDRLYMRLVPEESVTRSDPGGFEHATPWADGLVRVPVVDLPRTVVTPPARELRARGELGHLLDRAHYNTAALVDSPGLECRRLTHEDGWFSCVVGESFFTASLALVLPDLLARFDPGADLRAGVVVAVPHRHQLAFRVIDGPRSALDALTLVPGFAVAGWKDHPGPLSPHTYLWRAGTVSRLTTLTDTALELHPGDYLEGLMARDDGTRP